MLKKLPIALLSLMLLAAPLAAQDYHRGWNAFKRGDYATALKEWRPLAESGHAVAQFNLGLMYAKGRGVAQNEKEAVRWYRRAAEQGHVDAQNNLGFMYATGRGVEINHAEAVMWLRRAAEQGDADAQYNLGVMYMKGHGVRRDQSQAASWYRKAAGQGQAKAMDALEHLSKQRRAVAFKPRPPAAPVRPVSTATAEASPAALERAPDTAISAVPPADDHYAAAATGPAAPQLPKVLPTAPPPASEPVVEKTKGDTAHHAAPESAAVFRIQLLSLKTKARAAQEAGRLTSKHKPVLGSLKVVPVRADLGDRGVFYRLRAGPLDSRAEAASLCRKLSARNQGCLVVTR